MHHASIPQLQRVPFRPFRAGQSLFRFHGNSRICITFYLSIHNDMCYVAFFLLLLFFFWCVCESVTVHLSVWKKSFHFFPQLSTFLQGLFGMLLFYLYSFLLFLPSPGHSDHVTLCLGHVCVVPA